MSYMYRIEEVAMDTVRERVAQAERDQLVYQRYAKQPAAPKQTRRVARFLASLRFRAST
ncbi:MAG TPA: hypothetical protein VFM49_30120 [Chloroflexia bacterium]|nr:hypothetical protein [Chloroflexia bacterium]